MEGTREGAGVDSWQSISGPWLCVGCLMVLSVEVGGVEAALAPAGGVLRGSYLRWGGTPQSTAWDTA